MKLESVRLHFSFQQRKFVFLQTDKFYIESFQPNEYVFKEQGDWVTMSCSVNDHFDVCEWRHRGAICRLEYKWEWDMANARYHDNPIEEKSCPHHR